MKLTMITKLVIMTMMLALMMKITDEDVLSYHCSQDIPAGDASQGSEFSALLQTAARLADM